MNLRQKTEKAAETCLKYEERNQTQQSKLVFWVNEWDQSEEYAVEEQDFTFINTQLGI